MRARVKTWMTLLAGFLLGCSQDTFTTSDAGADGDAVDGTTIGDGSSTDAADASEASMGCGDLQTDPQNCGVCAHSCLGGDCDAGSCMPITLATNPAAPALIAVDDTGVYWTIPGTDGGVMRSDKDGGAQGFLVPHTNAQAIAVRAGHVYFTGPNVIYAVQVDGGAPIQALADINTEDIAVDGANVFTSSEGTNSTVNRYDLQLGALAATGNQAGTLGGVAIDGNNVYFALASGSVRSLDKTSLGLVHNLGGQATPEGVAVDESFVFWVNNGDGTVHRAATSLAASDTIATTQNNPHRLALDKKNVYWANGGGSIMRVDKQGVAPPIPLFIGPAGPRGIALDDDAVYWTNESNHTVMKLAKPAD